MCIIKFKIKKIKEVYFTFENACLAATAAAVAGLATDVVLGIVVDVLRIGMGWTTTSSSELNS